MATTNLMPNGATGSVTSITTADLVPNPTNVPTEPGPTDPLYAKGIPEPRGTEPSEESKAQAGENTDPTTGTGVEGEVIVWEARYSKRNFIGRTMTRSALTIGWLALAIYTWGFGHENLAPLSWIAFAVVAFSWSWMAVRFVQAHYSHYYRLTNRRLFVSSGMFHRRRDMMELLRVKDVFTRQQSLLERWLSLGTVVVVPSEKELPVFYVAGVDDPKEVMDLIWHHTRAERDQRSIKVDNV